METIVVGSVEAKNRWSKILDEVASGKRVIIQRRGKPVAELIPIQPKKKARPGCAKGPGFYMAPDFDAPLECFKDYM